jgi:hypothetical protein
MADNKRLSVGDAQGPIARADLLGALQDKAEKREVEGRILPSRRREPQEMQAAWNVRERALRGSIPVEQRGYVIQKWSVSHGCLLVLSLVQVARLFVRKFPLAENQARNSVDRERMGVSAVLRLDLA